MKEKEAEVKITSFHHKVIISLFFLMILAIALAFGLLWNSYQTVTKVEKKQLAVEEQLKQLMDLSKAGNSMALPQIEYLIKLANINLTLNNDTQIAIRMLQAADNNASKLIDPSIIELRKSLQQDIGALQENPGLDVPGVVMRLDNISDRVANLPVIPESLPRTQKDTSAEQQVKDLPVNASIWQRFYHYTITKLSHIVVIQHHETDLQPLLSASEQVYLSQSIQLLIADAKWAVINNNSSSRTFIYQQSLARAKKLILTYFSHNQSALEQVVGEIEEMEKINLTPKVPELSSVNAIEKLMRAEALRNS